MAIKVSNELKTGLVLVVSILVLVGVLYKTGDLGITQPGYVIKTRFIFSGGLKRNAPVNLAGLEIGEVETLQIIYGPEETVVEADLWIEGGVKIRKDSKAMVTTLGLMGEKYVELTAGTSSEFVQSGDMIPSKVPLRLDDLIEKADIVLDEVTELTRNANDVLVDAKPKVSKLLTNLEETSEYFRDFSLNIKHHPWKVLAKGKEKTHQELEHYRLERQRRVEAERQGEIYAPVPFKEPKLDKRQRQGRGGFF